MRRRSSLPAHVYRQRRRRPVGVILVVVLAVLVVGGGAYFYSARRPGAHAAKNPVVPPSPPMLVGIVSEIGSGSAIGTGAKVKVVDLANPQATVSRTIGVGTFPDAVAVSPDGRSAYVTNYVAGTVTPIDLATGTAGASIPAGSGPADIAITPDGKSAYVTDAGSSPMGDTVTPINLKTKRSLSPIRVGAGPQGIVITADGAMAYVTNAGAVVKGQTGAIGHTVTPIDLRTRRALPPITVGNAPLALAISSDGSTAFVTNAYSGSVSPISLATNTAGTPIAMVGSPQAIVAVPHSGEVIVANTGTSSDNLTVISVSAETATKTFPAPKSPTMMSVSPDGKTLWVVSSATNALVPISLPDGAIQQTSAVQVPGGPYALGLANVPSKFEKSLFAQPRVRAHHRTGTAAAKG